MSETGNYKVIPKAAYFKEDGSEVATPGRFNLIFDAVNENVNRSIDPIPICDAFTDLATYITDGNTSSTVPATVTIADVTGWPTDIQDQVQVTFSIESGNIGQLGSQTGSGAGAQVDWSIGNYVGSLGSDNTATVTIKMKAQWNATTKYAYTTFNLTTPSEKGDPGVDRLVPRIHCADVDMQLDGPVSGDAEFTFSDASMVLADDTISRAWRLYHADDLGTDILATAPNIYVGTVAGNVGDPTFSGGTNGSTAIQVPIKQAGKYILELWVKGVLDTANGDPITTTTAVSDKLKLLVKPYAANNITFNDGFQPRVPIHTSITQGVGDSSIIDPSYINSKAFNTDEKIHYVEVMWGYKPNEPDSDQAKIVKLNDAGKTALNLISGEYYLVNLNTGSLRSADYWNTMRLWFKGENTSGFEIIDTLSSSERTTIDGIYSGFNRSGFDTVVIKTHSNALIDGADYSSVLYSNIWQIGPGAEKYKVELAVLSPVDGTIQSVWNQTQVVSLDASRPAPISYRFTGLPKGLKVLARITSINGSVAAEPQITQALVIGYNQSWILSAPTNLNLQAQTFGAILTFDPVNNAAWYEIAYSSTPNPTFGGSSIIIHTKHTKVMLSAEVGSNIYASVRAIHTSGLAGASATVSGSASNVPIGAQNKSHLAGPRSIGSGDITRDARTLTYHTSAGPIRIRKMGVYVHSITLNGGNTNEYITLYNGDDTTYYSIPVSGEGYFTDDAFPVINIGQNERIRVAAWNPGGMPATFNDIEFSIDYIYDELDSAD